MWYWCYTSQRGIVITIEDSLARDKAACKVG
jgi:hypothetical protein